MTKLELIAFIRESNRIEGILREPSTVEITAYQAFLSKADIFIEDIINFVAYIQPGAVIRDKAGLNVRVGAHIPPFGSPGIPMAVESMLLLVNEHRGDKAWAYRLHRNYETLHPFTDGNGRSGRVLWLWMMAGDAPLGFLHTWYYQSLDNGRGF